MPLSVEREQGLTDTKSSFATGRTSWAVSVTTAAVRPDAITNSTASPSGSYTSATAPRLPLRSPWSGKSRSRKIVSRTKGHLQVWVLHLLTPRSGMWSPRPAVTDPLLAPRSDSRPRRRLLVCAQDRIHPSLPPGPLRPEPLEDFRIHAQGNRFLRRRRLQPPSYDAPHDMRRVSFGVTPAGLDVPITLAGDPCPISSRCSRSRFPAHASSPFALK